MWYILNYGFCPKRATLIGTLAVTRFVTKDYQCDKQFFGTKIIICRMVFVPIFSPLTNLFELHVIDFVSCLLVDFIYMCWYLQKVENRLRILIDLRELASAESPDTFTLVYTHILEHQPDCPVSIH